VRNERNVNFIMRDMAITSLYSILIGGGVAIGLLLIIFLISPQVDAAEVTDARTLPTMTRDNVQRGSLLLKLASGGQSVSAPILKTEATMDISGLSARIKVQQHFSNPSADWIEGVYIFPLPENAAVDRMKMRIGERVIEGEIKEKEAAERQYKQAKSEGKKASLLRQERANIFTTAVANIGPGEEVMVEIEYQQKLSYQQGQFRIRFPMVVAPRYIPGQVLGRELVNGFSGSGWGRNTDIVADASRITPPVMDSTEGSINPVSITINLNAGLPLARLESTYHAIESLRDEQGIHRITLKQENAPADRDFELVWTPKVGTAPHAALFSEQWSGEEYGLMMLMPPETVNDSAARPPREVVFVIDTSGSMHGASIVQARAALGMAIERLSAGDRFNVIKFNHETGSLFPTAVDVNAGTKRRALRYVNSLEADGGTEMMPALELALSHKAEQGVLRQVIFLTDGSVGNEEQLFEAIENRLGNSRLFTVGIGSAPNSFFMTRAAKFGRGSFTYIGKVEEVGDKMQRLFAKLESPVLTDISLRWPDDAEVEIWPPRIPDLYEGEPVILAMKLKHAPAKIQLKGKRGEALWQQEVALVGGAPSPGVHLLWARDKIADLMDQESRGRNEAEVREAVLEVSLQHQLVSRYTSLIAVDKTPSRAADEALKSSALPTNLPKGWSQNKVFGQLPQTATAAELKLLLGLLFIIVAFAVRWISRERLVESAIFHRS